jgi:hypothetical protein
MHLAAFLAIFTLSCAMTAMAQQMRIPNLHGATFAGQTVDLPDALKGKVGILVLGFSQASRVPTTDWGKRLAADYLGSSAVAYYEMPVLESVPRMLRSLVSGKIKADVSERARPTMLPVFDHEADWKKAVGFARDEDAYVLLVDEHGEIKWRSQGPVTDAAYAELKRHVQQLQAEH